MNYKDTSSSEATPLSPTRCSGVQIMLLIFFYIQRNLLFFFNCIATLLFRQGQSLQSECNVSTNVLGLPKHYLRVCSDD